MTLRILNDLEQRSAAWHDARRGIVTASTVGALITSSTLKAASNDYSRGLTAMLAAERITGYTEPTFVSSDMWRGILDEPLAVDAYAKHNKVAVETVGFLTEDRWGFTIGVSPDGLVGAEGGIEVKSRRQKKHLQTILADEVPAENMAQIQCCLLVSGRDWWDYVSYCGGMPLWSKRVYPDPKWQDAIVAAVEAFESNVALIVGLYEQATEGLPMTERIDHYDMEVI